MKLLVQLVLWVIIAFLGYKVYDSIYSSVKFEQVKEQRFSQAIKQLKNIRKSQQAHKVVTGKYARTFDDLAAFIDTAKFTITQRRDSSFTRYDKAYRIDKSIDTTVVDVLGYESIKDSLFKNSDSYQHLSDIIVSPEKTVKIEMKTSLIKKNDILYPVFLASVEKRKLLFDQPKQYLAEEDEAQSVEEINGKTIFVGSLEEVNTSGNWPIVYDK